MRILLFTGKGGVGKTTTAAATALMAARKGYRTLVVSTDPAHSLADALDLELGPEPVRIAPNLDGQEFDVYYSMKKYWGNMRSLIRTLFRWQGVDHLVAEELSVLPGMEEASAFLWLEMYYSQGQYDLIVIDSAPTGETLTLLSLPQVTQSWLMKAFPGQRFAIKTVGAFVRSAFDIPLDKGYEELETLFAKLERVQKILSDPAITSVRLVMNPERMVIQEARRAYTYLQLYGYQVDAAIVNRVLPQEARSPWLEKYFASQAEHMEEIKESFAPMPILEVPHQGEEVFGIELLERIGRSLYGERDPAAIFHSEPGFEIREEKQLYTLRLRLPLLAEESYELHKFGDELVIDIGNRRRILYLPRFAKFLPLAGHRYEAPWLSVSLKKE
jgi:arsenite-transporting ATPase